MSNNLTIRDIATLANVGKSTVSRVLNHDPKVKDETRQKILQVMKEHDYTPSRSAQGMRGTKSKVIGIIVSRLDSTSENSAVSEILPLCEKAGYDAVIMESQFSQNKLEEHLKTLKKRNVDGVIAFCFSDCDLSIFDDFKNKMVLLSTSTDEITSVIYNNYGAIMLVLAHLKRIGVTEISYVGVDPQDRTTGEERLRAYLDFCQREKISPCYSTGKLSYQNAYEQAATVIHPHTQAIVCATDSLALGVAKKLHQLHREDVIVTGVGGSELLSFMFPKTLSVDLGHQEAGRTATQLLLQQLTGHTETMHKIMPIKLIMPNHSH